MAIKETTFIKKSYLALKKSISIDKISDKQMYDEAGKKLGAYLQQNNLKPTGPWSVIYFTWDQENRKTDLAIAFPIDGLESVNDSEFSVVEIPESPAVMDTLKGSYEGLGNVHHALNVYMADHKLEMGNTPMAVEEYAVDPMTESNPENWVTNIYYLHK